MYRIHWVAFQEYVMAEYLRMSGVYWCLSAMDLMGELHRMNREDILEFIRQCQHPCGGFGASQGHDPHLLHTLSVVQVRISVATVCNISGGGVVAVCRIHQKRMWRG